MDYLGLIVPRCLPLPECSAPFRPLIASASAPAFSHSPLSPPSFFPPPSLTPRVRIHPLPTPSPLLFFLPSLPRAHPFLGQENTSQENKAISRPGWTRSARRIELRGGEEEEMRWKAVVKGAVVKWRGKGSSVTVCLCICICIYGG